MARSTFISYKYDDVVKGREGNNLRDRIVDSLGESAYYYKGEEGTSPDLSGDKDETIRKYLADKIFATTVTILIISKNMKKSSWIPWEISYSLRKTRRGDRNSSRNGIIGVIQADGSNNPYRWYYEAGEKSILPSIVIKNRSNIKREFLCLSYRGLNVFDKSYIEIMKEEDFLASAERIVERTAKKAEDSEKDGIYDLYIQNF